MFSEAYLHQIVRRALKKCVSLLIEDEKDVFRYIALFVLLTPEQRVSRLVQGTVIRVLTNLSWGSRQRLDFIYRHVVGRPVSANEMDFGPLFVPPIGADP
jgi:hypothetical protein